MRRANVRIEMAKEILIASNPDDKPERYVLNVFEEEGRWTSTLSRLDADGEAVEATVAPTFYGLTQEQARRRMVSVLENQYEEVRVAGEG